MHLNEDKEEYTLIGSLLTIGAKIFLGYIVLKNLIFMLDKRDPYVFSQIRTLDASDELISTDYSLDRLPKLLITVYDQKGVYYDGDALAANVMIQA